MTKCKIFDRKRSNISMCKHPVNVPFSLIFLALSVAFVFNVVFNQSTLLLSAVSIGLSAASMYLCVAMWSTDTDMYKNAFNAYFGMKALLLYTAFMALGCYVWAIMSLVLVGVFCKALKVALWELQFQTSWYKARVKK